jgi:hypothetical protein
MYIMPQSVLILVSVLAGIFLNILSNWLYDLLKQKGFLPEKPSLRTLIVALITSLPLIILVAMPQFNDGGEVTSINLPFVAATYNALEQEKKGLAGTAAAQSTQQAQIDNAQPTQIALATQFANLQATSVSLATRVAQVTVPTQLLTSPINIESFNTNLGFKSTSQNLYISQGKVLWNVNRHEGDQYLYQAIQTFKGDVRLTVVGQIDTWTNNCGVGVGIGDKLGSGIAINFGYYGGGCSRSGAVITAAGASFDMQENPACTFVGDWLWINPKTPTRVELTTDFSSAELVIEGNGKAEGIVNYLGDYNLLWIGMRGNGDWPTCSGEIDSIKIEPLQ